MACTCISAETSTANIMAYQLKYGRFDDQSMDTDMKPAIMDEPAQRQDSQVREGDPRVHNSEGV